MIRVVVDNDVGGDGEDSNNDGDDDESVGDRASRTHFLIEIPYVGDEEGCEVTPSYSSANPFPPTPTSSLSNSPTSSSSSSSTTTATSSSSSAVASM